MSVVKIFTPENRLSGIMGDPAGRTVRELIADADGRVSKLSDTIRQYVGEVREKILLLAHQPEDLIFAECKELATMACAICDVAAVAGLQHTGEAARGIYMMVDALLTRGVWHTDALKLHAHALALLSEEPAPSDAAVEQILFNLKAMREWVGVAD